MDQEHEYQTGLTRLKHMDYVRNNRAIVVLWGIFAVIYLILNVVVFIQPQWVGDDGDSPVPGYFGLWEYCIESIPGQGFTCKGDFLNFDSFLNDEFKVTAFMVGLSCLLFFISIGCFVLFCVLKTGTVLKICSFFQLVAAVLMTVSCIVYPYSWDNITIQSICGVEAGDWDVGVCEVRWAYVLAIVLAFDAFILTILGFVLASTQAQPLPDSYKKEKPHLED